jgi:hypothetical protein
MGVAKASAVFETQVFMWRTDKPVPGSNAIGCSVEYPAATHLKQRVLTTRPRNGTGGGFFFALNVKVGHLFTYGQWRVALRKITIFMLTGSGLLAGNFAASDRAGFNFRSRAISFCTFTWVFCFRVAV